MADFEFYALNYLGTAIPNNEAFNSVVTNAKAYVDSLIVHWENIDNPFVRKGYNNAICSVAEVMYQNRRGTKQSESVGNHSVSYKTTTSAEANNEMLSKAKMHLSRVGLLYGGL